MTERSLEGRIKGNLANIILIGTSFIVGVLWLAALRFFLVKPAEIHYHANFAVYVDGVREEFKSFTYYEEIAACSSDYKDNPKGRTHLHDNVNDIIHVHDARVTYADFFNNLDWTLGPNFVRTDTGLITNTDEKQWVFILNGERKDRVDNFIIGDQDKLLISYGNSGTDFMAQYKKIENKAAKQDAVQDPSSCSGLNGPGEESFKMKLKKAFWLSE